MIEFRDVRKVYAQGRREVAALGGVSATVAPGEFLVVLGASGSGKSTFLHLAGGLDLPTSGSVLVEGRETAALNDEELTLLRRKRIGFIFQFFNLIPTLNVKENVAFPLSLARAKGIGERVQAALEEVGLAHRASHFPNELSGGEMQRVAIARAVIHRPRLLLADEPTGNLDSKSGLMILELIRSIREKHRPTIVMATHSDRAAAYGDYIIQVADGRISR